MQSLQRSTPLKAIERIPMDKQRGGPVAAFHVSHPTHRPVGKFSVVLIPCSVNVLALFCRSGHSDRCACNHQGSTLQKVSACHEPIITAAAVPRRARSGGLSTIGGKN